MNRRFCIALIICVVLSFFAVSGVYAAIGVGVGAGKIVINDKLEPGMIYELTPLPVSNTGDVTSGYEVTVQYHEKQKQIRPELSWFMFSPGSFTLEPKKVRAVRIKLNLPVNAKPGDYFAYLEAHPQKSSQPGVTSVNIAAAAKLYFTVVPASVLHGIYYKIISFWKLYQPYTTIAAILLFILIAILLFRKFIHIEINVKKK